MNNKLLTVISAIIFIVVSVASTIEASLIDVGSHVLTDPLTESGHIMTMRESVLHNLPSSMVDGIFAAGILVFLVFVFRKIRFVINDLRTYSPKHGMRTVVQGASSGGNVASRYDEEDSWLDEMLKGDG